MFLFGFIFPRSWKQRPVTAEYHSQGSELSGQCLMQMVTDYRAACWRVHGQHLNRQTLSKADYSP